jgi:predicted metalloprotease with PDZ domain
MRPPALCAIILGFVSNVCVAADGQPAPTPAPDDPRFAWVAHDTLPEGGMAVAADLTDLAEHGLLHTRVTVPAKPDEVLAYPLWIPGTHAPAGPVANLGGVTMRDDLGRVVGWERDPHDPWKFIVHPAANARQVIVDLVYIADQPTTNSLGVDVATGQGYALMAWNTGVVYPLGTSTAKIPVVAEVRLPRNWDTATRLRESGHDGDVHRYEAVTLDQLIDRPFLAGAHLQSFVLQAAAPAGAGADARPEVVLHIAGSSLQDGDVVNGMRRLPGEASALFGGAWFERYDFLLVLADGGMGLEHGDCSVDGTSIDSLNAGDMWSRELMPHEFTHSWVGKYRRPVGMLLPDFQQTPVFDGLWVYEGLTECLGRVLAVRSGLASADTWREAEFDDLINLANQPGRRWRPLRDICRCNWQLRGGSNHHSELRRDQDYYSEGALFWIAVDRRLRGLTHGARGLDDFCRAFFGPKANHAGGFTEDEVVAALNAQAPADWAAMIHRWIDVTGDLDTDAVLSGSGWKIARVAVDPDDDNAIAQVHETDIRAAAGFALVDNRVTAVDPGSAAATAGMLPGDFIVAANGAKLSRRPIALVNALAHAVPPATAVLTVNRAGTWETLHLSLPGGITVASLVRDDKDPDGFAAFLAPRVPVADETPAAAPAPAPAPAPAAATAPAPAENGVLVP